MAALAPIQPVSHPVLQACGVRLSIKREDLLCPFLGGNKLYKLHYHLQRARALQATTLVSFGGAYSNHIYALARAGFELGLKTRGIIRGERPKNLSPTLQDAEAMGMQLMFVSRTDYKNKHTAQQQQQWGLWQKGTYTIPEGGAGLRGALGLCEYWQSVQQLKAVKQNKIDAVVIAAGTGASLAGVMAASSGLAVHGMLMLKGSKRLTHRFAHQTFLQACHLRRKLALASYQASSLAPASVCASCITTDAPAPTSIDSPRPIESPTPTDSPICWQLHDTVHGGGYGPAKGELQKNIHHLSEQTQLPLDPVYTGKMLAGIIELAKLGYWRNQHVLAIHTGGLQGARELGVQL